jgi:hypothetical protein
MWVRIGPAAAQVSKGNIDEVRVSNSIRYAGSIHYPSSVPFVSDGKYALPYSILTKR